MHGRFAWWCRLCLTRRYKPHLVGVELAAGAPSSFFLDPKARDVDGEYANTSITGVAYGLWLVVAAMPSLVVKCLVLSG